MTETQQLISELEELRSRLAEAEETIEAIRTGEVDALVVQGPEGQAAVYTLTGAERVYRLLVEAMNEGALVLSPNGSIIYSNHTFAAMLGVPLEQVIGSSVYDYVTEEDKDDVQTLLTEAAWVPGRREIGLQNHRAGHVPANISVGSLDVEEAGESISAVVTDLTEHKALECQLETYREHLEELVEERTAQLKMTVDQLRVEIDARKAAEEAVREGEERLWLATDASGIGTWAWDLSNDVLLWSPRTCELLGIPTDTSASYERFLELVHPDDRQKAADEISRALAADPPGYDSEYRVILRDGSARWLHAKGRVFSQDRAPIRMLGVLTDITERKQAEQDLRDSEARFRSVVNSTQDAIVLADDAGVFVDANPAAEQIFDLPLTDLIGKSMCDFIAGYHYPRVAWDESLRRGSSKDRFRLIRSDGSVREMEGHTVANVLPGRHMSVMHDITDRVTFERRQQELYQREHRIAEMLQQALIPSQIPRRIDGWSVAAKYLPALEEALVGGDFYDVFRVDENRVGVLIGDVVGKGLVAAVHVAAVRYAIRSYAYTEASPGRVMTLTNDSLCKDESDESNALTAFFGILELRDKTLTYANAGHEPPVVRDRAFEVTELETTGPMLGILPGATYFDKAIELKPQDCVVMLTDGITEARTSESVLFEKQGVLSTLKSAGKRSPDDIAEALLSAATKHAGGNLQDDVAIVVIACD